MRILIAVLVALVASAPARAETLVRAEAVAEAVAAAIATRLPSAGRYRVALSDPGFRLILPAAAEGRYEIAALTFDPLRQSFTATLAFSQANGGHEYVSIAGAAAAVLAVPVLVRDVSAGETIAEADLTTIEVAANRTSATLLTSPASLSGQAARRPLRAGVPLFAHDVKKPVVIKKGELVTIVYSAGGIELSVQGQAKTEAGMGDTVQLLNPASRRTIEGRVTGPGMAEIVAPAAILARR